MMNTMKETLSILFIVSLRGCHWLCQCRRAFYL